MPRILTAAIIASVLFAAAPALAEEEFAPPQGKGRVVVVVSGQSGPEHYRQVAAEIAKLGFDAVLFDGNPMEGTHGQGLKDAIAAALAEPHALPGKVGLVGFSLGGVIVLGFGTAWSDQVAAVAAWYPATVAIHDPDGWAARLTVPTAMFAGESDTYKDCCHVETAHALETAAKAHGANFALTTYPDTEHDFVVGGSHYNPSAYGDAFQKTAALLKQYLGN